MKLPPAHGTPARARQHYRDGTPMCEPCRLAQRTQQADRRAKHTRPDLADKPVIDWDAAWRRVRKMLDDTEVDA